MDGFIITVFNALTLTGNWLLTVFSRHTKSILSKLLCEFYCLRLFYQEWIRLFPSHLYPHEVRSNDFLQRVQHCQWFLNNLDLDNHLEKNFHLSGYVTSHNTRMWSSENSHFFFKSPLYFQKFGGFFWAAITQRRLLVRCFI